MNMASAMMAEANPDATIKVNASIQTLFREVMILGSASIGSLPYEKILKLSQMAENQQMMFPATGGAPAAGRTRD
jgi:hypothetical protein